MSSYEATQVTRARRPTPAAGRMLWRKPTTFRLKAAPASVEFSPVAPHDFAVASSLQVDVFSTETNAVYRTLSRFKDTVRCACYRHDGRMLAAGDDRGCTQLFDVGARTVMRTFSGHSKAVHVARFAADGGRLFTASDDANAHIWDIAAEAQVGTLEGHTDFVRSGSLSPASPHLFATGSYDHTAKLWDVRTPRAVMTLRHVAPVEDVLLLPGGGMLGSASGSSLTVRCSHTAARTLLQCPRHAHKSAPARPQPGSIRGNCVRVGRRGSVRGCTKRGCSNLSEVLFCPNPFQSHPNQPPLAPSNPNLV